MSKFNILYWNTHYTANYQDDRKLHRTNEQKRKYLDLSSEKIIIPTIENIQKKNQIDAIVFTECWPQDEFGSIVLKEYLDKNNFDTFPYNDNWNKYCSDNKLSGKPYKILNGGLCSNGILIAVKHGEFEICDWRPQYPDFLMLKKKDRSFYLAGVRINSEENVNNYQHYIETLRYSLEKKYSKRPKSKIICIGDFNPGVFETRWDLNINNILNSCQMKEGTIINFDFGTLVNRDKQALKTDKVYCVNADANVKVLNTPEQIYCKNQSKYLDENGRIKNEYLNDYNALKPEYYDDFFTDEAKECEICIKYENSGPVNPPFPDHNLLYASIDLGD